MEILCVWPGDGLGTACGDGVETTWGDGVETTWGDGVETTWGRWGRRGDDVGTAWGKAVFLTHQDRTPSPQPGRYSLHNPLNLS